MYLDDSVKVNFDQSTYFINEDDKSVALILILTPALSYNITITVNVSYDGLSKSKYQEF